MDKEISNDKKNDKSDKMKTLVEQFGKFLNPNVDKENKENTGKDEKEKEESEKLDLAKLVTLIRMMSSLKLMKEDQHAIEIIDSLFIGSVGVSTNKEELINKKISHIVIAASSLKPNFPQDFTYKQVDVLDCPTVSINNHFIDVGDFIDKSLKEGGKVLVHCYAGKSRSSTLIISYLIKYKSMSFEEALKLCQSKRSIIQPNEGFVKQLKDYEEEIKKEMSKEKVECI